MPQGRLTEEREQPGEKSALRSSDRVILAGCRLAKLHAERCREPVTRKKACLEASHGENVVQTMPEEHCGGAIWEMSVQENLQGPQAPVRGELHREEVRIKTQP